MTHPTTDSLKPPEAVKVALVGASAGREACLDLLLAEELSVDHDLALWFLAEAGEWRERPRLPDGDLVEARSRINYWDDGMLLGDQGETDIHLTFRFSGGEEVVVLVEDKVWAPYQLRQPERYVARAHAVGGVAVLVAPSSYLRGRPQNAAVFHGAVAIEDLIDRIRHHPPPGGAVATRRAEWRARLLEEVSRPRARAVGIDDPPTVAFTEFCTAWLEMHSPASNPDSRSCHTAARAGSGSWRLRAWRTRRRAGHGSPAPASTSTSPNTASSARPSSWSSWGPRSGFPRASTSPRTPPRSPTPCCATTATRSRHRNRAPRNPVALARGR